MVVCLFPFFIFRSSKDKPSTFNGTNDIQVHHLQTEFIFEHPILRSLVAEASSIFTAVQEVGKQPKSREAEYLKLSRTYRSTVRACLEKLQDSLINASEEDTTTLENYITIFYSVECVWHLCEILLIDQAPSNVVVPQLLDWIRFHFPAHERRAAELLFMDRDDIEEDENENNKDVLTCVKGLISQGQVEVARTLLRMHSAADSGCFQIVDEILKTMPVYSVSR